MKSPLFSGKVVWITGASSGIGEALAYEFCRLGAKIILSSRNETELNRVKENCTGDKNNIFVLPFDLSATEGIEAKAKSGLEKWGRIDYLVHNAGIAARDTVPNTGLNVYRAVMETNYFGPVALTKYVLPSMIASGSGHLVVISSLSGKYGVPKLSAYSASKHALHGFFDSLRTEVSQRGIKISMIIPGFIKTSIVKRSLDGKGDYPGKNLDVNEGGMPPEICAAKIIKAVRKGRREALIGRTEILTVYMHRFFPDFFLRFISNHPVRKLQSLFPRKFKSSDEKY